MQLAVHGGELGAGPRRPAPVDMLDGAPQFVAGVCGATHELPGTLPQIGVRSRVVDGLHRMSECSLRCIDRVGDER